jgi:hypothetical protein
LTNSIFTAKPLRRYKCLFPRSAEPGGVPGTAALSHPRFLLRCHYRTALQGARSARAALSGAMLSEMVADEIAREKSARVFPVMVETI